MNIWSTIPRLFLALFCAAIALAGAPYTPGSDRCPSERSTTGELVRGESGPVVMVSVPECVEVAATEIPELKQRALSGSIEAARKLERHYGSKQDWKEQVYWQTIAVANGNSDMRLTLAFSLSNLSDDPKSKIRARTLYWQIIHDGPAEAAAIAREELAAWERYEKLMRRPR